MGEPFYDFRVNHSNPVRIMVAGGDGTVMWAMSEVMAHNIDVTKVAFGVIPFGTGNDFARSLGWGGSSPSGDIAKDGMKKFKRMVKRWLDASVCEFDVWEVSLHVDSETGRIRQVKDKGKVVMLKDEGRLTSLSKPMCNYFSMGLESRIGLGFDKKRQNSSFMNKMVYGWEGLKKTFMSTPRIDEVVESVDGGSGVLLSFSSDKTSPTCVKGSPVSLIFMNINSFAGGCDLWTNSKKLGTHQPSPELKEVSQSCGDGQLEVITYNSLPSLSAEQMKVFGGNGLRIAQEAGPVRIAFKKNTHKRSYMQIDGEFFTLDNPTHAEIVHKWKVNVLKGPKN